MDRERLAKLLRGVRGGKVGVEQALESLANLATADLGFARIDHHRDLRRGFPEVVFGEGKTLDQVVGIAEHLARRRALVLVTRVAPATGEELARRHPRGRHDAVSRTFVLYPPGRRHRGRAGLTIVSAGTADLGVAEEAAVTAEALGLAPDRLYDVGVAGLHRLLEHGARLRRARAIIVVAGMEGALPSVVAGLVRCPVIGVPTSVGYGTALGGLTALFGMLNSCAGGLTVVNIDNGFGAACAALAMLGQQAKGRARR
ncbi:MAG: nickel pincer cofactor biosynthesis protein LarB [Acidobacteria bacterium]|nr:nickel pincer cofactor biosynthesis protein LarB [Acidobacteriota bacterium]